MGRGSHNRKKKTTTTKKPSDAAISGDKQSPKDQKEKQESVPPKNTDKEQKLEEEQMDLINLLIQAMKLWDSWDVATKKCFLEVKIKDMENKISRDLDCPSLPDTVLKLMLESEELEVWFCFKCNQLFSAKCDFLLHLELHLGDYFVTWYTLLDSVDAECIESILDDQWVPIDVAATTKLVKKQQVNTFPTTSLDPERLLLIQEVWKKLVTLVSHNCLAEDHVLVIRDMVESDFVDSPLLAHIEESRLSVCICFSSVQKLRLLIVYLNILIKSSQLDDDDKRLATSVAELDPDFPRILLSLDKTSLILDIKPFRREGSDGEGGLDAVDTNKLVVWVFTELSFHSALLAWNDMVNRKEDTSKKCFKNIGHQFIILQEAWEKKRELIAYIDAVHRIKGDTLYSLADIFKCKDKLEKVEYSLNTNKNEFDYVAMRTLLEEAEELSTESLQMAKASLLDELSYEITYEETKLRGALYKIRKLADLVAASSQFNYSCVYLPLMNSFLRARLKSRLDDNVKLYSSEVLRERNLVNSEPPSIEIAEGSEEEDGDDEEEELLLWQREFWK